MGSTAGRDQVFAGIRLVQVRTTAAKKSDSLTQCQCVRIADVKEATVIAMFPSMLLRIHHPGH